MPSTLSSSPDVASDVDGDAPRVHRARLIAALVALVLVLVIVGVTVAVVVSNGDDTSSPRLREVAQPNSAKVGEVAPDFELTTLDGKTVRLSDYRGRPVVLNFWASWCNPCRREFPLFRAALARHRDRLAIVGVDTGDLRDDARRFARQQHADWPNGFDADGTVARGYGVDPLPQTFFIRADGVVASHVIRGLTRSDLDRELRTIGVS